MSESGATDGVKVLVPGMRPRVGLAQIIDHFTARIRSIGECAADHIKLAEESGQVAIRSVAEQLSDAEQTPIGGSNAKAYVIDRFTFDRISVLGVSRADILSQSLMIFGFSTFDAYLGLFLARLYRQEKNMVHRVEEKSMKLGDLLNSTSIEEAIDRFIARDISSLLRDSYEDVFEKLAGRHSLKTLTDDPAWAGFAEAAQRRNLVTHCDGVVNAQYIKGCKDAGFRIADGIVEGKTKLVVSADYLRSTFGLLYEIGIKLGITLWRTAAASCIAPAEVFLTDEIFSLLLREEWRLAAAIGKFAIELPKQASDLQSRISRINYAQALKWLGDHQGASRILSAVDWTSSIRDLRLGVEVVRENYDNAASLMLQIGKQGELVSEDGYREWPIFREFRKSPQFSESFLRVYGMAYAVKSDCSIHRDSEADDNNELGQPTSGESEMPSGNPIDLPVESSPETENDARDDAK